MSVKGELFMIDFILRPWREEDAHTVARFADNPRIAANLRDIFPYPYSLEDAREFIGSCIEKEGRGQLTRTIEINGEAAGSIGIFLGIDIYRRSAELGYWLGRPFWRQGIMTASVEEMCALGFAVWDIVRIYAEPYAKNAGSRGVLEKVGFTLEGVKRRSVFKNGEFLDSCIYAKLRD